MHLQRNWARVVNVFQKTLTGGALRVKLPYAGTLAVKGEGAY